MSFLFYTVSRNSLKKGLSSLPPCSRISLLILAWIPPSTSPSTRSLTPLPEGWYYTVETLLFGRTSSLSLLPNSNSLCLL